MKKPDQKIAVIYARYSSDNQSEASIEQQVDECQEYAMLNGLTVSEIYADRAISGRIDSRAEFQRMIHDAERGKFQIVIAYKSSRLARNMMNALSFESKMKACHVQVICIKEEFGDNPTGRFMMRNMMNINQWYSENLAEDVIRGMTNKAKKCEVNGQIPFGYRKGEDNHFAIREDQAEIVREIYQRVADGELYVDIANDLNARGIKTKTGGTWGKTSFDRILRNEMYIGTYRWRDIVVEDGMPAILDKDLFYRVQEKVSHIRAVKGRHNGQADYMLTGRLFCGHCKKPMIGISGRSQNGDTHYYYVCQGKLKKGCTKRNVRKDFLEEYVFLLLKKYLLTDEVIDWMVAQYMDYQQETFEFKKLESDRKRIKEIDKELENIIKAIKAGIFSQTLQKEMSDLEGERAALALDVQMRDKQLTYFSEDRVRYFFETFRDTNIQNTKFKKQLIRQFIKRIELYDNEIRIAFEGFDSNDTITYEILDGISDPSDSLVLINSDTESQTPTIRTLSLYRIDLKFVLVATF